jgi:hypothetical protein
MRNLGCQLAKGAIIAQWDDDDWYSSCRLTTQAGMLLNNRVDVCALRAETFFNLSDWSFWQCSEKLNQHLFPYGIHDGTLAFWRWCWARVSKYPNTLSCDSIFFDQLLRAGSRIGVISSKGIFIYVRHTQHTSLFRCGKSPCISEWQQAAEPPLPDDDKAFYQTLHREIASRQNMGGLSSCGSRA